MTIRPRTKATLTHAKALVQSVADDAVQSAALLGALGLVATTSPVAAVASVVAGAGFLCVRPSPVRDPLGRTPADVLASTGGFGLVLGREVGSGNEVVLDRDQSQRHLLVTGTTASFKTEYLLGLAEQAMVFGSGAILVDGKGDVSLWAKVRALARRHGREDDILCLNMLTGGKDVSGGGTLISNTLNPFATGSSEGLVQVIASLMDEVDGDGAIWKKRALGLLACLMRYLVWMRDERHVPLDAGVIRDHVGIRTLVGISDPVLTPDVPEHVRGPVRDYLASLPGFNPERGTKQAQTTLDHHGYLEMQFTKILGSLADTYGHIFKTPYGEIDMQDVVLNRRILVVMLPALEKSGDELANLGKIVVATLKATMAAALGNKAEGDWSSVVALRVTNSPSPFLCVLDDVGYYTVEGLALVAAQARSLGFSMVYATDDVADLRDRSGKEGASVFSNVSTKVELRDRSDPAFAGPADTLGSEIRITHGDVVIRATAAPSRNTFEARDRLVLPRLVSLGNREQGESK